MLSSRRVSGTSGRDAWLSLTPEPERELPDSVAMLRAGGAPTADAVERERARVERLVVRARSAAWLTYLREVVALIERAAASDDPEVRRARSVALQVVHNHHELLLGLPGSASERTANERSRLEAAAGNRTEDSNGGQ
jgi:hypothetical protein